MKMIFLIYWIATTIAGVYLIIKTPSDRKFQDDEFSLLDVVACVFPCACIAWVVVPMVLLHKVKFKR